MPFNVMLQLCRVTRASKLFQRNYYLPLLRPLSPKDALRRYIITGKHLLGHKVEHYIPVLEEYQARVQRRKYMIRGKGKKRQRKRPNMKYVMPFFDMEMEHHEWLEQLVNSKSTGRGQCYTYYVPEKDCTLVVSHQFERAIRDKDILDITMAQGSEKILVMLKDGTKITVPLVAYDGKAPFYRGEGWTRKDVEEYHHFGKETMSLAKLFEAKEQGVEEWELEMMRLANKRKRKVKGEGTTDWKKMMALTVENMDWDQFEEDIKQTVAEINEPVDEEPIPLAVDDMDKTKNVNEKLKAGGPEVLNLLPTMPEIPEILKIMHEGEMTEMVNVSGVKLQVPSTGTDRFVAGQMVKSEEGEMFMPGQTIQNEDGQYEYTPGFTVLLDEEPALIPGLVMGDHPEKPMFLPGESTITEGGELQFIETEDDRPRPETPSTEEESEPEPVPEVESESEPELEPETVSLPPVAEPMHVPEPEPEPAEEEEEEELTEEEEEEEVKPPPPPPPRKEVEFKYERPKRLIQEASSIKRRERKSKRAALSEVKPEESEAEKVPYVSTRPRRKDIILDMSSVNLEKDVIQQEKERIKNLTQKKVREELSIEKLRREIAMKAKKLILSFPPAKYVPLEPVKKSTRLQELEESIKKGDFFNVDYKKFLVKERRYGHNSWKTPFQYKNTFESVGISRRLFWKSVY